MFPFAVHFAEAMDVPIIALSGNQFAISKAVGSFEFIDPFGLHSELGLKTQVSPLRQARSLAGQTLKAVSERLAG